MPAKFYLKISLFLVFFSWFGGGVALANLEGPHAPVPFGEIGCQGQQDSSCREPRPSCGTVDVGGNPAGHYHACRETGSSAREPVSIPSFAPPTSTRSFSELICNVTNLFSQQLLPPLAVLMMLVVGFFFLVSGGDPGKANAAKKAFFFVLIGTALLVLAPGIVALLSDLFGGFQIAPLACQGSITVSVIVRSFVNLVNWFSWFVAITSVVMGLYAGFLYMTGGGDAQRITQASRVLSFTIIGVAVSVVAFSIISIVRSILGQ